MNPSLSIVIPAYDEGRRLGATLERVAAYVVSREPAAEIVVVDDGSGDDTAAVARAFPLPRSLELRLLDNGDNCGKGFSVRRGLLAARAPFVLFSDADLSTPIDEAERLLAPLRAGTCEVAIGSRAVDRRLVERPQALPRDLLGRCFNVAVRLGTGLAIADTQCGFKAFRRDAVLPLVAAMQTDGFGFDVELLVLCRAAGLRIEEIGVRWRHAEGSKVHVLADGARMLKETAAVMWRLRRGDYQSAVSAAQR